MLQVAGMAVSTGRNVAFRMTDERQLWAVRFDRHHGRKADLSFDSTVCLNALKDVLITKAKKWIEAPRISTLEAPMHSY